MTDEPLFIPEAREHIPCAACDADDPIELASKARFDMEVRSVLCRRCGLAYTTPRPTMADMARYYATSYRKHYASVGMLLEDGSRVGPGDPAYDAIVESNYQQQAACVRQFLPGPGCHVLEIGCRNGRTLNLLQASGGIIAHGVEPGEAEAERARAAGVQCFTGTIEQYDPGETRFQVIQLFHVLEHVHAPLAVLCRLRNLLLPGGTLVVEVPNVYQPYGLFEQNFLQNVHLFNFSSPTLSILFRRAGLTHLRVVDESTLWVVGTRDATPESNLPLPYSPTLHPAPAESGPWVRDRLQTYANLEIARHLLLSGRSNTEALETTARLLRRPALVPHLISVISDLAEHFVKVGTPELALTLVRAARTGPHDPEVLEGLGGLERQLAMLAQPPAG